MTALLAGVLGWAYLPLASDSSLSFKWEGLVRSKINFRDAGDSINACLGEELLQKAQLFRSSHFFSGWSCGIVGNPDVIYSLETYPEDGQRFYCRAADGYRVGKSFQTQEISDLEFLETWRSRPEFVRSACQNILSAMDDLSKGRRVLIQCEAGRDRTGAVTAIIAAKLLEEKKGRLSESEISALECDYRKSQSLKDYKYGRIENFLKEILKEYGSVRMFLDHFCE